MVSSKFRHKAKTHGRPKICIPPPPVPPIPPPPPAQSYADCSIAFGQWDDEQEDCFGHWEYARRIPLQLNPETNLFEELDPPPCPNVYCSIAKPTPENDVAHIEIRLWGDNCDFIHEKVVDAFQVDVPEPDHPWVGGCNNWDLTDECNELGEVDFVLYT